MLIISSAYAVLGQAGVEIIRDLEQKVEEVYNLHGWQYFRFYVSPLTILATVDAQITAWLQAPDPSTNHHLARQLHHADSGEWFVNSQSFQEWSSSDASLFWVHGKRMHSFGRSTADCMLTRACSRRWEECAMVRTSLHSPPIYLISHSSTVIERLKTVSSGVVYFYHDFRDADKQTARGLLAALVLQFGGSSESHISCLRELHRKHGPLGSGRPGTDVLWTCFQELVTIDSLPVTVIIDALDECFYKERSEVLALVEKISEHAQMRLFMTSRPEADIQLCMRRLRFHECNLHELDAQAEDMRAYIARTMSTEFPFSGWPRDLVDLTVDTLASEANGM